MYIIIGIFVCLLLGIGLMNPKKPAFLLVEVALLIVLFGWLIPNTWLFSTKLINIDRQKYDICQGFKRKITKQKSVEFVVTYGLFSYIFDAFSMRGGDTIFFSHRFLKDPNRDFEVVVTHELGHIEYGTRNQVKADFFSMKLLGKERVVKYRKDIGLPQEYLEILMFCFDSNGNNCPHIDPFSDYKTPR